MSTEWIKVQKHRSKTSCVTLGQVLKNHLLARLCLNFIRAAKRDFFSLRFPNSTSLNKKIIRPLDWEGYPNVRVQYLPTIEIVHFKSPQLNRYVKNNDLSSFVSGVSCSVEKFSSYPI